VDVRLQTKYGLREKVWLVVCSRKHEPIDCSVCDNTRKVKIEGQKKSWPCPNCTRGGAVRKKLVCAYRVKRSRKISEVEVRLTRGKQRVDYYAGTWLENRNMYDSEAKAQRRADKLNKQEGLPK